MIKIFGILVALFLTISPQLASAAPTFTLIANSSVSMKQPFNRIFLLVPNPGIGPGLVCGFHINIKANDISQDKLQQISEAMTIEEGFRFNGDQEELLPQLGTIESPSLAYLLNFINGQNFVTFARITTKNGETLREMLRRITHHSGYRFRAYFTAKTCE